MPPWLKRTLQRAAWSVAKFVALVALTGVALGSASLVVESSVARKLPSPPRDSWIEVNRPIQLYGLAGTEFAKLPLDYSARRNVPGGGRQDVLSFGSLRGSEPYLRLVLYRVGSEAAIAAPFGADLEGLGGDGGWRINAARPPTLLSSRFGIFEVSDLRLVADRIPTPCLGFRSTPVAGAILRVSGFICGTADKPVGRDTLGCVIDRIDLDSAGDDTALRGVFVEAERRRGPDCAPSTLTAAGAKTTWLDANASLPRLKGLLGQVTAKR